MVYCSIAPNPNEIDQCSSPMVHARREVPFPELDGQLKKGYCRYPKPIQCIPRKWWWYPHGSSSFMIFMLNSPIFYGWKIPAQNCTVKKCSQKSAPGDERSHQKHRSQPWPPGRRRSPKNLTLRNDRCDGLWIGIAYYTHIIIYILCGMYMYISHTHIYIYYTYILICIHMYIHTLCVYESVYT